MSVGTTSEVPPPSSEPVRVHHAAPVLLQEPARHAVREPLPVRERHAVPVLLPLVPVHHDEPLVPLLPASSLHS